MCDRKEQMDPYPLNRKMEGTEAVNMRQGTARPFNSSKGEVMDFLHQSARDLEMQAAGRRRLADVLDVLSANELPIFAAVLAMSKK